MHRETVIHVENLSKTYATGLKALDDINLSISRGEIFALLGPNGAGKTTLINVICGIANASEGKVKVQGKDIKEEYRLVRSKIGLVPQELTTDMFETVIDTVSFSRALFGKRPNKLFIEQILKGLTLWNKQDQKIMTLSGGMKRRVMIAKALSHEPEILFLDEPTAGVDVELRREMWAMVKKLRDEGVTIILTTHYIEEAQEMADRIGIINEGKLILVEEKKTLMRKLGKRELIITLKEKLNQDIRDLPLLISEDKHSLIFSFDRNASETGISDIMKRLDERGIDYKDLKTQENTLEDIFVELIGAPS